MHVIKWMSGSYQVSFMFPAFGYFYEEDDIGYRGKVALETVPVRWVWKGGAFS